MVGRSFHPIGFSARVLSQVLLAALLALVLTMSLGWQAQAEEDSSSIVLPTPAEPRQAPGTPVTEPLADGGDDSPDDGEGTTGRTVPNPTIPPEPALSLLPFAPSDSAIPTAEGPCDAALAALGAVFTRPGRVEGPGRCGIEDTVRLEAVGRVQLQPAATLACPTALTFSHFARNAIVPALQRTMDGDLATVHVAASYACRGRNNNPNARLSEHSFGRAIDVRAVTLRDGRRVDVMPSSRRPDSPEAAFQAAIRQASCGPFTTVLGPGSDGHHQDHLHFDVAPRNSTYCR